MAPDDLVLDGEPVGGRGAARSPQQRQGVAVRASAWRSPESGRSVESFLDLNSHRDAPNSLAGTDVVDCSTTCRASVGVQDSLRYTTTVLRCCTTTGGHVRRDREIRT